LPAPTSTAAVNDISAWLPGTRLSLQTIPSSASPPAIVESPIASAATARLRRPSLPVLRIPQSAPQKVRAGSLLSARACHFILAKRRTPLRPADRGALTRLRATVSAIFKSRLCPRKWQDSVGPNPEVARPFDWLTTPTRRVVPWPRKVKKLKRQRPWSLIHGPDSGSADLPAYSWAINGAAVEG
jgi:hypothetical protein